MNPFKMESIITEMAQGYTKNFMLNSAEHEMFMLINGKMTIFVGILTFMNRKK